MVSLTQKEVQKVDFTVETPVNYTHSIYTHTYRYVYLYMHFCMYLRISYRYVLDNTYSTYKVGES